MWLPSQSNKIRFFTLASTALRLLPVHFGKQKFQPVLERFIFSALIELQHEMAIGFERGEGEIERGEAEILECWSVWVLTE